MVTYQGVLIILKLTFFDQGLYSCYIDAKHGNVDGVNP